MTSSKPRGILRNKSVSDESSNFAESLDRQEVIRNTRLNAQLASQCSEGDLIRSQLHGHRGTGASVDADHATVGQNAADNGTGAIKSHTNGEATDATEHTEGTDEHLKWDEINLYKTEQEKAATMKIDEPKTPYEGGFNPDGEYYQEDEPEADEIPDFSLGKGEFDNVDKPVLESLNGGKIIPNEDLEEEPEEEEEAPVLSAEERHKLFEERRKAHYHMKGDILHHSVTNEQ